MGLKEPLFSVVIPTYNRPDQLARCLQELMRLDYPTDRFEVIVVDDGSQTSPSAGVKDFQRSLNLTLISQTRAGPAGARNAGARVARGEYLAFTDDDCRPGDGWLKALAGRFFQEGDTCAIGGQLVNALPDNLYSTASQALVRFVYGYYGDEASSQAPFFATNNLAVPAGRFFDLGGFDTTFMTSEDREFCDRWLQRGYRLVYAPEAVVYHAHPLTLGSFLRQHYGYGRGAYRFHRVRARRGSGPFRVAPRFYVDLLRYAFTRSGRRGGLLAGLLILSQAASAAGYLMEMLGSRGSDPGQGG